MSSAVVQISRKKLELKLKNVFLGFKYSSNLIDYVYKSNINIIFHK